MKGCNARGVQIAHDNGTWKLTNLPKHRKSVGCKYVFSTKRDASGNCYTIGSVSSNRILSSRHNGFQQDLCQCGQVHHHYMHCRNKNDYGLGFPSIECKYNISKRSIGGGYLHGLNEGVCTRG